MNQKAYRVLEFDRILAMLEEECVSEFGAEYARALEPSVYRLEVVTAQQETAEAVSYILMSGSSPVHSFDDIRQALDKARLGSALTPAELLAVARTLSASRGLNRQLLNALTPDKRLYGYAVGLASYREVEEEIRRCILGEEEIADTASHDLARIRRAIRACHVRIRDKMNSLIRSPQYQKYLQEPIITIRNDRYVVPVRQEFRGQVAGLVHDQSGSGQTLFVEPMAVVEINNELKELMGQEREEIQRILRDLTEQVGRYEADITQSLGLMAQLDFVFAKGKLALRMNAVEPVINDSGYIRVVHGRHPLIDPKAVVPMDLWLGEDFSTLVITGPNTGGKTVTLKCCGLMALMAQSGLHVPGDSGCTFPIFDEIYADIGDEQSIEQSLSTFSSHMTNLVDILKRVTHRSLVLLDELGAGTDPTEGAALAIAILERLTAAHVRTLATTHYSELKVYALSTPGVENASVEFDVASLRPTYRLSIGVPGKSNAFEISKRLGLEDALIERAKQHLSQEQLRFEDVIQDAEYHRQLAEVERKLAEEARREMEELRQAAEKERRGLLEQRDRLLREGREEAQRMVRRARNEADQIIAELKRAKGQMLDMSSRDRAIQQARDAFRQTEKNWVPEEERQAAADAGRPLERVEAGQWVTLADVGQVGKVVSCNDKGEVQVQVGALRLMTKLKNLRPGPRGQEQKQLSRQERRAPAIRMNSVPMELDIRGKMGEEGIMLVDKYLDEAVMAGLTEVNIIHGKGTGALRAAIVGHLRNHPHVASFRGGKYGEGDAGVTVVTLR